MTLHLVRHAEAVPPGQWPGEYADRPLTDTGDREAHRLATAFGALTVPRVLSSPHRRCQDTVAPLARRVGVEVEIEPRLAEGSGIAALDRVEELMRATGPDGVVVACSHGDVLGSLLQAMARRSGLRLPRLGRWQVAGTWLVDYDEEAQATAAEYRPVTRP